MTLVIWSARMSVPASGGSDVSRLVPHVDVGGRLCPVPPGAWRRWWWLKSSLSLPLFRMHQGWSIPLLRTFDHFLQHTSQETATAEYGPLVWVTGWVPGSLNDAAHHEHVQPEVFSITHVQNTSRNDAA